MNTSMPQTANAFSAFLKDYRLHFEEELERFLEDFTSGSPLEQACAYALKSKGKRLRPALVTLVTKALNSPYDPLHAAMACEFLHTASLIADDLPCMDNDSERRHQPALHKAHTEATALLASFSLIAEAYRLLTLNSHLLLKGPLSSQAHVRGMCAVEWVSRCTGILGACGGQQIDLFPPDQSFDTLMELMYKKTGSLFEVSLGLGWIFGGGDIGKLSLVARLSEHLGNVYQTLDDLQDCQQDSCCKANSPKVNAAQILGRSGALKLVAEETEKATQLLHHLGLATPPLVDLLELWESEAQRCR